MANFFREPDQRQQFLLPVDMKDWVPETDMVHLLLDVVTLMELTAFEAHYTKRGSGDTGSAGDTPPSDGSEVEDNLEVIGYSSVETVKQSSSNAWTSVSFNSALDNPSVVMGPLTFNGHQPATMRVRDVTDTGFQFQVDEWDYLDGGHIRETVSWLAVESGVHELANGAVSEPARPFQTRPEKQSGSTDRSTRLRLLSARR